MTFKSLSSLQYMNQGGSNSESGLDDALATPMYGGENDQYVTHQNYAVTQEFDLSSKPGGRSTGWRVPSSSIRAITDAYSQYLRNPQEPNAPDTIGLPDPSREKPRGAGDRGRHAVFRDSNAFRRTSVSGFGQAIYHVTDDLRATAGFRYTDDRNSTFLDNYFGDPSIGGGLVHLNQHSVQADVEGRAR